MDEIIKNYLWELCVLCWFLIGLVSGFIFMIISLFLEESKLLKLSEKLLNSIVVMFTSTLFGPFSFIILIGLLLENLFCKIISLIKDLIKIIRKEKFWKK